MAFLFYINGVTEEYKPRKLTFTEEEIITLFSEYDEIKTVRIPELLNTWCVYGTNFDEDVIEDLNTVVSEIVDLDVFSHALFIHDSEINPKWNATDSILYYDYSQFKDNLKSIIDDISEKILNELTSDDEYKDRANELPKLITKQVSEDGTKRVIFAFDTNNQSEIFYLSEGFVAFCDKVYAYISKNKQHKEPFTIYEDKKSIIIIENAQVLIFLDHLIKNFEEKEEYEICTEIQKLKENWETLYTKHKLPIQK
ncbi:hypothetical protein M0Q50_06000 [bacterium]|jgi:hypothetical protein|nr:hypothetical protein [bacterium]